MDENRVSSAIRVADNFQTALSKMKSDTEQERTKSLKA
jgi:hypothetical protein